MNLDTAPTEELEQWLITLEQEYQAYQAQNIKLDLTRGKPSAEQLTLADTLDGSLNGNYLSADGTDTRNYGGLSGIKESRELGAELLGVKLEEVSAQGNSSLSLMFLSALFAKDFGFRGANSAWKTANNSSDKITFICPVPGYDRHFSVCEQLGINMVTVPMTATGPDMDAVEALIKTDKSIRGLWCVPKYSNPTGVIYSNETVSRIAKLGQIAADNFLVFWDNAYAVHDLKGYKPLANIMDACREYGTENNLLQFASTSKITHAGAGVAFIASSVENLSGFHKALGIMSIGPDKVNQLRHSRLFPDRQALLSHMEKHATILKPRFDCVQQHLSEHFSDNDLGEWESVDGGYFVSFDSKAGLAKNIVQLAADVGVKLTPAGATFPYNDDPLDNNIRIAPSVPTLEQVDEAMKIFVLCVKLASVRQKLDKQP
ncbi:MAG: aminotransferase class I/II-fold pyridoxal phosphate-dependent enzyme [Cellvibrionaceae bacterium]